MTIQARIHWCARQDSNLRPLAPEAIRVSGSLAGSTPYSMGRPFGTTQNALTPDQSTPERGSTVVLVVDPSKLTPAQLETLRANGAMYVTVRG
jgi:hypothetical protein